MSEEGIKLDKRGLILILGLAAILLWFRFQPTAETSILDSKEEQIESRLVITKLALKIPIIFAESSSESEIQEKLQRGVVHLAQTALPGETGNCYIVGHSSDYAFRPGRYKTIFAQLPELQIGDEVEINSSEKSFKYLVTETKVVEANDLTVLSQETDGQKILTLQTSYPIGTARQRFLVIAKFVEK